MCLCVSTSIFLALQSGETWSPPENMCKHYTCIKSGESFSLFSSHVICPPFQQHNCLPVSITFIGQIWNNCVYRKTKADFVDVLYFCFFRTQFKLKQMAAVKPVSEIFAFQLHEWYANNNNLMRSIFCPGVEKEKGCKIRTMKTYVNHHGCQSEQEVDMPYCEGSCNTFTK